jgi:hypothetical protein
MTSHAIFSPARTLPTLQFLAADAISDQPALLLANPHAVKALSEESCGLVFVLICRKLKLTFELARLFDDCHHESISNVLRQLDLSAAAGIQTLPSSLSKTWRRY